jgi:hypothetical protein
MLWNLMGLQRKLDALFDEGWIRLGVDTVHDTQWHLGDWFDDASVPLLHRPPDTPSAA